VKKDYYEILGAQDDAPRAELDRRYRRLASERHPDRGGTDEEMKDLNEAYRVLRDPAAREAYDATRRPPAQTARVAAPDFAPRPTTPGAQADAIGGRVAGSLLCLFAGLVLVMLVRFHYVVFLWPLALLGLALVLFGVWMAHAAMVFAREAFAPGHLARRTVWAQEAVFWCAFAGGCCALYLLLTAL
jgi:hypothetical protein